MRAPTLVAAILLLPFAAGCFESTPQVVAGEEVLDSAEAAGAVSGPAPVAPQAPYRAETTPAGESSARAVTVYPVAMETNGAKAPVELTESGEFAIQDCNPVGGLPLGGFGLSSWSKSHNVTDAFTPGDVFAYDLTVTWTNTDQSWGEIHPWHRFGPAQNYWQEPNAQERGAIVVNFTGQGYFGEGDLALFGVDCWYGGTTSPIQYTATLKLTFAEASLPAETPTLLDVPEGATTLFARGVSIDPAEGVQSHFRVFGPDDRLVCECALDPMQTTTSLPLKGPGKYVVLVDHTANGFVSLGLDQPSPSPLLPLKTQGNAFLVHSGDGNAVDEVVELDVGPTPLAMFAWVFPDGWDTDASPAAGYGQAMELVVTNTRGTPLIIKMGGYVTARASVPGVLWTTEWYPIPVSTGDWAFIFDHHAYDAGQHFVAIKSDALRGDVVVFAQQYVRP